MQSILAKASLAMLFATENLDNGKYLALKWSMEALRCNGEEILRKAGCSNIAANCQYLLGVAYCKGEYVAQNEELGRKWLEKAIVGGNSKAIKALDEMETEKRERKERELAEKKAKEEAVRRRMEEPEEDNDERPYRRGIAHHEHTTSYSGSSYSEGNDEWSVKAARLRMQYNGLLAKHSLTEVLFSLDHGCAELILLGPGFNEKYRIDYFIQSGDISHTITMPEHIALELVTLRTRIWIQSTAQSREQKKISE